MLRGEGGGTLVSLRVSIGQRQPTAPDVDPGPDARSRRDQRVDAQAGRRDGARLPARHGPRRAPALSCLLPLVTFWRRRFSGLPPGPAPPSWVGNMLKVDVADLPRSLRQLSHKYGPIYTFHLGFPPLHRPFRLPGIAYGSGEGWKQLCRFAVTTPKNLGMGKRSMEHRIQEEAQHLLDEFHKTGGEGPSGSPVPSPLASSFLARSGPVQLGCTGWRATPGTAAVREKSLAPAGKE
ncbi:cytochrome P450 2C44-like [Ornithorhynchus anatinus]|uniref:cytochrome P450 2C44-like n=1 Tax=Ornithorhynchus anatinus TaxID=9258 RepID=UPI0019D49DA4|nr:cytochrome P450 2C44-like [Ornithorhynchus anatinus]